MLSRRVLPVLLALALAPATSHAVEPGVVIGANTNVDEVAKTKELGAGWVRIYVDWSSFDEATTARRIEAYSRAGVKVLVVVSYTPADKRIGGTKITPPTKASSYGDFIEYLARNHGRWIDAYEMWNEPDENIHFAGGPNPELYVPLLQEGYNAVQRADADAVVVTGGMVGNNFDFLDAIYKLGGKGYFDAVGVHTDLACENDAPEFQYRDEAGRIGRYVFTGYREVAATMADHGDSKPIWMTEMGWPTPNATCMFAGSPMPTKENEPGGVDYPTQADYLRRGFECMQGDGLVDVALWFSLQDVSNSRNHEERFGLIESSGAHKPAFAAMQRWARERSAGGRCGEPVDRGGPSVTIQWPPEGFKFAGPVAVKARATDDVSVSKMEMFVNGKPVGGSRSGDQLLHDPWWSAKELDRGDHKLTVKAWDGAKNVGQQTITIRRVTPGQVTRTELADLSFSASKKQGRKVKVCARVSALPDAVIPPTGKVRVFMDIRRGGRWKGYTRLTATAAEGLCRTHTLRMAGRWRIYGVFAGDAPYRRMKSKPVVIRAR